MSKLSPVDFDKVIKVLTSIGYTVNNQKGSHIVMRLTDHQKYISLFGLRKNEAMVVIPAHKPIGKGMVRHNHSRNRSVSRRILSILIAKQTELALKLLKFFACFYVSA